MPTTRQRLSARRHQGGFTLIEITVVFLILVVLAVIAIPRISSMVAEGKAPAAARELQQAALRIRGLGTPGGTLPYAAVGVADLGALLRNTSFSVVGTPATAIRHAIGAATAGPTVTIQPVNVGGTGPGVGTGFTVLLSGVDQAACVSLVTAVAAQAAAIAVGTTLTVAEDGSSATVKPLDGPLNGNAALLACDEPAGTNVAVTFR